MAIIEKDIGNFYKIRWLDEFMIGHKGFIAGGCFKNIFNDEKIKDIDIFFNNNKDFSCACDYYDGLCGEDNTGGEYRFYYENQKVKAYKQVKSNITIELVCNVYGTPEEVLNMFDFTITKFAYAHREVISDIDDSKTIEHYVMMEEAFFEHIHLNRLVVDNNLNYPISTFERMIRYIKYGYYPCKETKMKILDGIRSVNTVEGLSENMYDGLD